MVGNGPCRSDRLRRPTGRARAGVSCGETCARGEDSEARDRPSVLLPEGLLFPLKCGRQ